MSASGGPASVRHRRARFARERFGPHLPESSGGRTSGCRRGALVSTPWRTAFARDARPQRAVESTGSRSLSRRACWTVSPIGGVDDGVWESALGERDVGDWHPGPDTRRGLHRELHRGGDVPVPGPARRPQGPSRGRRALRPPVQEGPRVAGSPPARRRRFALPGAPTRRSLVPRSRSAESCRFLRRRRRQPHIVRGYCGGPHVRYILDRNPMSF